MYVLDIGIKIDMRFVNSSVIHTQGTVSTEYCQIEQYISPHRSNSSMRAAIRGTKLNLHFPEHVAHSKYLKKMNVGGWRCDTARDIMGSHIRLGNQPKSGHRTLSLIQQ